MTEKFVLIASITLGFLFVKAGLSKIPVNHSNIEGVLKYGILGRKQARIVAYTLPFLELIIGIFLLLGILVQITASISLLLLVVFLYAVTLNLLKGRSFECFCFGKNGTYISILTFARNSVLLGLNIIILIISITSETDFKVFSQVERSFSYLTNIQQALPILASVIFLVTITTLLDSSEVLFRKPSEPKVAE
jgi:uncharacterized membrane protein YphA (DoxX/SURF4 family)